MPQDRSAASGNAGIEGMGRDSVRAGGSEHKYQRPLPHKRSRKARREPGLSGICTSRTSSSRHLVLRSIEVAKRPRLIAHFSSWPQRRPSTTSLVEDSVVGGNEAAAIMSRPTPPLLPAVVDGRLHGHDEKERRSCVLHHATHYSLHTRSRKARTYGAEKNRCRLRAYPGSFRVAVGHERATRHVKIRRMHPATVTETRSCYNV